LRLAPLVSIRKAAQRGAWDSNQQVLADNGFQGRATRSLVIPKCPDKARFETLLAESFTPDPSISHPVLKKEWQSMANHRSVFCHLIEPPEDELLGVIREVRGHEFASTLKACDCVSP
jgi:hypothetical protein